MQEAQFPGFGSDSGGYAAGEDRHQMVNRRKMMNIGSQPQTPDVPEADALEQQTPVLPEGSEEFGALPDDASEADAVDQHTDVRPDSTGYAGIAGAAEADAAEADLIEQAIAPSLDDEEEYPDAHEQAL
jgi:hypothetical protein